MFNIFIVCHEIASPAAVATLVTDPAMENPMAGHAARLILAFVSFPLKCHPEYCSLAEFSCYLVRDVVAHVDLAAEARAKQLRKVCCPPRCATHACPHNKTSEMYVNGSQASQNSVPA